MMDWNFVIENEGLINYLSWVYKTKISYCLTPTYTEDDYSEYYISEIVNIVKENFKFKKKTNKTEDEITNEILQTIKLLSKGYDNKNIAKLQNINESTVSRRIRKIRNLLEEKYL